MKLAGKVAIVTGATSGIGKAIALAFAKEGAVVVTTGRNPERLDALTEAITKLEGECLAVPADVTKLSDIDRVVEGAVSKFDRVDILVNAAGIYELAPFTETDEEFYERTMNTNFKAYFFMAQRAAKEMIKQGRGKIINLTSMAGGTVYFPEATVYCAAKAAGVALTKTLAVELAPHKINVNCISPGSIRTPMINDRIKDPEILKTALSFTPWDRMGETDDITPGAVYLASDDSDYVTGMQLVIDGGVSCCTMKADEKKWT